MIENYLDALAVLIVALGIPASIGSVRLALLAHGANRFLYLLSAGLCAYISAFFVYSMFTYTPGNTGAALTRPAWALAMALCLSNVLANLPARKT